MTPSQKARVARANSIQADVRAAKRTGIQALGAASGGAGGSGS